MPGDLGWTHCHLGAVTKDHQSARIRSWRSGVYRFPKRDHWGFGSGDVLTALAFAEATGLPGELWRAVISALYQVEVRLTDLSGFANSSAANFLVKTTGGGKGVVYQLFHQAPNDSLLSARSKVLFRLRIRQRSPRSFRGIGRSGRWAGYSYLLRSLPSHAAAAGLIDRLLADDEYLLHADLSRLITAAGQATAARRDRARLLRLTLAAVAADPGERVAMFSVPTS